MKFFELSLRLYDRGSNDAMSRYTNDAMSRYRLLCFDGKSETAQWETFGNSIAECIFNAGYSLVRGFALGLNKQP